MQQQQSSAIRLINRQQELLKKRLKKLNEKQRTTRYMDAKISIQIIMISAEIKILEVQKDLVFGNSRSKVKLSASGFIYSFFRFKKPVSPKEWQKGIAKKDIIKIPKVKHHGR